MSEPASNAGAPAPMQGGALAITAIALSLGTFMQVLDTTIANVSIPTISGKLGASTMAIFVRTICAGFATSITTTFWDRREAWHQSHLVQSSSAYDPSMQQALDNLHAMGLSDAAAYAALNRQVVGQAYLLSSVDYFWISAILSIVLISLVWLAKRPTGTAAPAAAD